MTSIFYKIVANYGEIRKIVGSGVDPVRIYIDGADEGVVAIGRLSAPLKGGRSRLSLSLADDGEQKCELYTRGGAIPLEPILKLGERLSTSAADTSLLRRLAVRTEELEAKLGDLISRVAECEGAIRGKPLFKND